MVKKVLSFIFFLLLISIDAQEQSSKIVQVVLRSLECKQTSEIGCDEVQVLVVDGKDWNTLSDIWKINENSPTARIHPEYILWKGLIREGDSRSILISFLEQDSNAPRDILALGLELASIIAGRSNNNSWKYSGIAFFISSKLLKLTNNENDILGSFQLLFLCNKNKVTCDLQGVRDIGKHEWFYDKTPGLQGWLQKVELKGDGGSYTAYLVISVSDEEGELKNIKQ